MTNFKPGDRVRLSEYATTYRRRFVGDSEGTVLPREGWEQGNDRVTVDWDNKSTENYPSVYEIELVEPAPRAYTPADLRAKVAEMRNERDEKYAESDRLRDEADALSEEAAVYEQAATALEKIK